MLSPASLLSGSGLSRRMCVGLALLSGISLLHAASPVEVAVVAVQMKGVNTGVEYDAVIEPIRQATVSAQASGRIASLQVKAGDRVRAGQLLATIDDRETQTGVQRSAAQAAQAEAEWRNAQVHAQRTRDLQAQGFVSKAALDVADTQLKAAQAARDQAGAGVRQSSLAQGFTRVTAPFDGVVLETPSQAGDLAVPGKPMVVMYAPQPLRAVVQVPASRAAAARGATQVEVRVPGAAAADVGLIPVRQSLMPAADPVAQTVEWRLDLPERAAGGLVPGQQVKVRFAGTEAARLLLPASSVVRRGELTGVYVAQGEAFALKAVRLGADHGAAGIEVLAGLGPQDRVAVDAVRAGLAGARPAGLPATGATGR